MGDPLHRSLCAGCGTHRESRPAAAAAPAAPAADPAATTTPGAADSATTPAGGPAGTAGGNNTGRRPADAVATARAFLRREIGMGNLVAGPFRSTGPRSGEVAFRLRTGEGGRALPPTGTPATVVRLWRDGGGWVVLGAGSPRIRVAAPARLARIASPVAVSGRASAFEGTVQVAVREDRAAAGQLLGRGFVTGSGTARPGPFSGRVAFRRPSARTGWLVFYEESAATDGGIAQATALRVRFATTVPAPRILAVRTTPELIPSAFALDLPAGAGKVVVRATVEHATSLRLLLTPTGTGTADLARLVGEDTDGRDGWSITWRYPDAPLLGYLTVRAVGPGGTAEKQIGVHHPDPSP